MRQKFFFFFLGILCIALPSVQAGTKEEIMRLQSDVLALRDQFREFEKSFNDKMDGLKSLTAQLNDQVAKSNLLLERVSTILENQASGANDENQAILQEIRTLASKIDDNSMTISAMAQQLNELKIQSNSLIAGGRSGGMQPPEVLLKQANDDLMEGKLELAIKEFQEYLNIYPGDVKAAEALLNMGVAFYYQKNMQQAINAYTRVINDYPSSDQVASALFKRANVELETGNKENAIADFKNVIEKFPSTPESEQARTKLEELGVSVKKPTRQTGRRSR